MNREDILKAAQEESQNGGEYENQIGRRSAMLAAAIAIFVVIIMFLIEYIAFHRLDFGKPAIICLMSATSDLYEGIRTKKARKIIFGVITSLFSVLFIGLYIGALF